MSDVILVATIVAFFVLAAVLVRACGHIAAGAAEDVEPEGAATSDGGAEGSA